MNELRESKLVREVVSAYLKALREGKAAEAYGLLSEFDRESLTSEEFAAGLSAEEAAFGKGELVGAIDTARVSDDGRRAEVKISLRFENIDEDIQLHFALVRQDEWRISLLPSTTVEHRESPSRTQTRHVFQPTVEIAGQMIGAGQPCFIIAEAGVNHDGNLENAKQLIHVAADANVNAVKFQTFTADLLASPSAPKAEYQLKTTGRRESQLEMLRPLELGSENFRVLYDLCNERGIMFLSTPFDEKSADLLSELNVPAFKIGSGDVTNWPLLRHVAAKGKPIILSTGMSNLNEVDEAMRELYEAKCNQLILMHCVSRYPADPKDVNLRAIQTMAAAFNVPVGFSDHTLGIEVSPVAVALGACVIEKHFTLDKTRRGPDHKMSVEPGELSQMVIDIRAVEDKLRRGVKEPFQPQRKEHLLGDGIKQPVPAEVGERLIQRRSLAALEALGEGTILSADMLISLRPGTGISPVMLQHVKGRRLNRRMEPGDIITWDDLK
jgi:N-acetylneuraminate synthase/N,N'-diacetyllegionaminate synthase